eukprot:scpid29525/ scgid8268/ Collagen type IV alpha-3-binding protein; Ceramide transfer protein
MAENQLSITEDSEDALLGSVGSEDDLAADCESPQGVHKRGTLSKWTNFFHGWQNRYVVLSNGTLSYYRSEFDTTFGCRGSMSLGMARIEAHEYDPLRFDVAVNDSVYYLRCGTLEERQEWLELVKQAKLIKQADQGYSSDGTSLNSLQRAPSLMSVNSVMSVASNTSKSTATQTSSNRLKEKMLEMETFRDILNRQVDTMQGFFDQCSATATSAEQLDEDNDEDCRKAVRNLKQLSEKGIDFRGESITFRATLQGLLSTISYCNDLITRRDETMKKRLEREIERRRKAEQSVKSRRTAASSTSAAASAAGGRMMGGPDFEEGPYCAMKEDDFLDAIENECDRMDQEEEEAERRAQSLNSLDDQSDSLSQDTTQNPAMQELEVKLSETLRYCYEDVGSGWTAVHEDGDMKVYRRDLEEGGVVLDPLKAIHTVPGVTAYELTHYFFDEKYRLQWEGTLDSFSVLERLSPNTLIMHQVHKRVWPSSQRDVVFVSHKRELPQRCAIKERGKAYVVCNCSTEHEKDPNTNGKFIRAKANIFMLAHTLCTAAPGEEIDRSHITCQITYSANVNPGGWAPPSVVRAVSKREYPKFLRRFSQFVVKQTQDCEIEFGPEKPDELDTMSAGDLDLSSSSDSGD